MESRTITISRAAKKHGNLNIASCGRGFFPKDVFGSSARNTGMGKPITLNVEGLPKPIKTDIPTDKSTGKPRGFFRERAWVKEFVNQHGLRVADTVIISRISRNTYKIIPGNGRFKGINRHKTSSFKVVSLFSGCGGLDLGFKGGFSYRQLSLPRTKFQVTFANDFDIDAVNVFNANSKYFGKTQCLHKNIHDLKDDEVPEFDILLAGFPCQPFSNAGKRQGVHDEDGRGTLFYQCERLLKERINNHGHKPPLAFVFENVRGILSSHMPDGHTVPEEIRIKMKKLGFKTSYKLLRASDYGVPQNRYRVFMIGVREDLPQFDFSLLTKTVQKAGLPNRNTNPYELYLGSILSDIPENASHINEHWAYSPTTKDMILKIGLCPDGKTALVKFKKKVPLHRISSSISQGRSWKNIPPSQMTPRFKKIWDNPKKYRAPNFYRRFALGEICGTITASGQPENSGITHPFAHRRFSIREIARIQTFPDDFVFPYKSISSAYKVIGNAVPPILGWVVAKTLQTFLLEHGR